VTVANNDDTTPPTFTSKVPASGAVVSGVMTMSASATDNVGTPNVTVSGGGVSCSGTGSASCTLNLKKVPVGTTIVVSFTATDAAGNRSQEQSSVVVGGTTTTKILPSARTNRHQPTAARTAVPRGNPTAARPPGFRFVGRCSRTAEVLRNNGCAACSARKGSGLQAGLSEAKPSADGAGRWPDFTCDSAELTSRRRIASGIVGHRRPGESLGRSSNVYDVNRQTVIDLARISGFDWDAGNARRNEAHGVSAAERSRSSSASRCGAWRIAPQLGRAALPRVGPSGQRRRLHITFTLGADGTKIR